MGVKLGTPLDGAGAVGGGTYDNADGLEGVGGGTYDNGDGLVLVWLGIVVVGRALDLGVVQVAGGAYNEDPWSCRLLTLACTAMPIGSAKVVTVEP